MNQEMKTEFLDTGVSSSQRPVSEDSSISNTNIAATNHSVPEVQRPAISAPALNSAHHSQRTHTNVSAKRSADLSRTPMLALPSDLLRSDRDDTGLSEPAGAAFLPPVTAPSPAPVLPSDSPKTDSFKADSGLSEPVGAAYMPSTTTAPAKAPCNCGCGKKSKKRKAKKSLVVEAGETKFFDKCAHFDKIENKGKIELAEGASLTAEEIINTGTISSQFDLTVNVERINSEDGFVESPSKITLASKNDLIVRAGDFVAPKVKFDAEGKLDVYAHRIDGKASAKGSGVSFGVKDGDLIVEEHICTGDPVYWSEGTTGTFALPDIATFGEDLVIWSNSSSISVGSIDTITGGSGPGRVTIITNAGATRPGSPTENPYDCSDCSSFVPSGGGGGTVLINADFIPSIKSGGPIEIRGDLTSDGYVWIETPATLSGSGGANTVKIAGSITTSGQPAIIRAGNKVQIDGDITTGSSSAAGGVEIQAYQGADGSSSTEFVIGGSGQSNGVNGNIDCSTAGSGTAFVFIRNYGTGGLSLESTSAVNVQVSGGHNGSIALDAKDGVLTLPAGTISVDGASSHAAGRIFLMGDSIDATAGATTLTASDEGGIDFHKVQMAAATYSFGSGGLTIKSNGGGGQQNDPSIGVFSKGSIVITSTIAPPSYTIVPSVTPDTTKSITIDGSGALKLEANNLNAGPRQIWCEAKDITFTGGTVDIDCNGDNCKVLIANGQGLLKFAGGAVTLNSNGFEDSDGANVTVDVNTFERTSDSTLTMHADGDGTGNGGHIAFAVRSVSAHPIVIGSANGNIRATADGGSDDGNGGRIDISSGSTSGSGTPITIKDSTDPDDPVLSVAPKGDDGDGGIISIITKADIDFTEADNELHADGKGNGKGGSIFLTATGTSASLDLGDNILSAKGGDTGDGGLIQVISNTDLTVKAAKLTVTVGQDDKSNGKGGQILGKSEAGDIIVEGNLNTDGKGKGKGGLIYLDANQTLNYGTNDFSAKGGSKGDGGKIYLKSGEDFTIAGSKTLVDPGQDNDSNGEGGTIQIESGADLTITGTMNANGKGKGKGGKIFFTSVDDLTTETATVHIDGGCMGHGGTFGVSAKGDLHSEGGIVTANSGDGVCINFRLLQASAGLRGGDLSIVTEGDLTLVQNYDLKGTDGKGGTAIIESGGTFSFGTHAIHADGEDSGDGGIISITSKGGDLTIDSGQISAKSGTTKGNGGIIHLAAKNGRSLTVATDLDVSGHGDGDGGHLLLEADTSVSLSEGFTLKADGGEDDGDGGSIEIISKVSPFNFTDVSEEILTATGGGEEGLGGRIVIPKAFDSSGIDFRSILNVDGGTKLTPHDFAGSISLNNVECRQWRILIQEGWPVYYWSSTQSPPNDSELILANRAFQLNKAVKNFLGDNRVELLVHKNPKAMQDFFSLSGKVSVIYGETFRAKEVGGYPLYVNTFYSDGRNEITPERRNEAAIHELGHAMDISLGNPSLSDHYNEIVLADFLRFDYTEFNSAKDKALPRDPCGGDAPPLYRVPSSGGLTYCGATGIVSQYRRWTNSLMAQKGSFRYNKGGAEEAWGELFAQAFAYKGYLEPQNVDSLLTGDAVVNQIFDNGFFGCVAEYASQIHSGNFSPALSNCFVPIPAWYAPGQFLSK